ncbi:MAG: hypothetical protein WCF16_07130 [Alphaproteobacteria bacterium]
MANQDPSPSEPSRQQTTLALVTLALFLMVAFQTAQLFRERYNLAALREAQDPTVQEGMKLRQQFESLAAGTAQLADEGDAGAQAIVEAMRRQGINLKAVKK